jgi:hypothetical protein
LTTYHIVQKFRGKFTRWYISTPSLPNNGQSRIDFLTPGQQAGLAEDAKHNGEGYPTLPILDEVFKVNRRDARVVDGMCIKHPLACFRQKVSSTGAISRAPRRTYVLATGWGPPQPFMANR